MTNDLRVAVVGAGLMGADHVGRIATTIAGATVAAVVEPDGARRAAALDLAPGAAGFADLDTALASGVVDAVLVATPGQFHEEALLKVLAAGLPVLCEKPLTQDPDSSWRVVEAEMAGGRQLIQVGFMRRFDREYEELRKVVAAKPAGELVMLHARHRNASVPESYVQTMLINDSVVHEFDVVPWLAGGVVTSVEVKYPRRNSRSPEHLREPILVLMELDNGVLVDVEMNVSIEFGYQVETEAVFERGVARIGEPAGLQMWQQGRFSVADHGDFTTRFREAYDRQVQAWVDAAKVGTIAGPSAFDGYKVAVCCAAGVRALETTGPVPVELPEMPAFYAERG
ncbi:Inositol 2-dehydrogenase/D-chiro-inositol 3-dehydrogenase (plasmid) [Tsukamurella tyrosinosolvens]|uniref:Inositol 2-dehydrogenase n=1 Tax=Tsukamurella tyrosinosolvens TaxID=57704 RepID=A0A1H4Y6X6_TSUTY|nr:Gfo/Idh/MocA family oxidoreductase [Tsukamurella tyrosinosolvens]KXP00251.1 inositol 2-dehydrogenase [Tsukamurella tyrosinosolvens]QRY84087.1 Gfo/Idh/MocA family oxidoreductase [Tsukamurella tyrosinosolvens]SED13736.1 myo-inositol 2-dehydrogenase [Tsukamurella tyrosinosolvens]VEH92037.1 Inositol 2-dehydrogenase/D-chiro-inositol 3-dehydrogenase [Tsukamurella tyrosinosolvens]